MTNYSISEFLNPQGILTCSVCGKEFKPNDDTKYFISGGFTCSWQCFLIEAKKRDKEKLKK